METDKKFPVLDAQPVRILEASIVVHSESDAWAWGKEQKAAANEHFEQLKKANPTLWNGPVFLCRHAHIDGNTLRGKLLRTDYATYLYHRELGWPDKTLKLMFGSAFIQSENGSLFFGRMSQQTTSPGMIIAPSGGLGEDDIDAGIMNPISTAFRECKEEFGIELSQAQHPVYFATTGRSLCVYVHARLSVKESALLASINQFIEQEENSEIDLIHVIRSRRDLAEIQSYDYAVAIGASLLETKAG